MSIMMLCATCEDTGRILHMWWKPGGLGNGWGGCPDCETGRAHEQSMLREIDAWIKTIEIRPTSVTNFSNKSGILA